MSRVCELLDTLHPVIQGAMGVICNPELVAAVSDAGGYGLLGTTFTTDVDSVRAQVRQARALTHKPFGANLFAMNPRVIDFAAVLAEEEISTITVSGGSPKQLIPFCHARGMKVIVVVPTVDAAVKAESLGADAIVAEGCESGGAQGFNGVSSMVLVPAVVDRVKVPVIAAGGIGDSRGYRAALALGAEGVQIGTRFIATKECIAHEIYKKTIVDAEETGTHVLSLGRLQVRALRTPMVEQVIAGRSVGMETFSGEAMENAWVNGDIEAGFLLAGQVCGLIHGISSVREIIEEMVGSVPERCEARMV